MTITKFNIGDTVYFRDKISLKLRLNSLTITQIIINAKGTSYRGTLWFHKNMVPLAHIPDYFYEKELFKSVEEAKEILQEQVKSLMEPEEQELKELEELKKILDNKGSSGTFTTIVESETKKKWWNKS